MNEFSTIWGDFITFVLVKGKGDGPAQETWQCWKGQGLYNEKQEKLIIVVTIEGVSQKITVIGST